MYLDLQSPKESPNIPKQRDYRQYGSIIFAIWEVQVVLKVRYCHASSWAGDRLRGVLLRLPETGLQVGIYIDPEVMILGKLLKAHIYIYIYVFIYLHIYLFKVGYVCVHMYTTQLHGAVCDSWLSLGRQACR